ncbi:MAG TPA: inositol monophosphatase family protein [Tahibacter sp.]|uniref:inositol monophosphatase family protein n=1 Tax=Tahibacter sp. TaxID=2056211 RepID=UPI002CA6D7AE|nr:inositol monophosphatase family protein [Tahibacter sp.]HSX61302.1 inositol monophosphatase family protein [Tahibacter sp.]
MNLERHRELLDFALTLAAAAQDEILPHYQRCAADLKADGTEVTLADRAAERAIRAAIAQRHPDHAVLGEEFGGERGAARQWIVDPLDGTSAFALGLPLFGTLIAYAEHDEPLVGVIHFPVLGETVYAARGLGCWFRDRNGETTRVRVRAPARLAEAVVSASGVHASDIQPGRDGRAYALGALIRRAKKFRVCGDCLQHALVCRGSLHAAIDTIMQPWDIAALVPCIEEAGGVCSALDGRREQVVFGGGLVAACDRGLLGDVLSVLNANTSDLGPA